MTYPYLLTIRANEKITKLLLDLFLFIHGHIPLTFFKNFKHECFKKSLSECSRIITEASAYFSSSYSVKCFEQFYQLPKLVSVKVWKKSVLRHVFLSKQFYRSLRKVK